MPLTQPLSQKQINAACRFHRLLPQWHLSDAALLRLHRTMPGFDEEACVLKAVAVNVLYGTNVYAIVRMARHICRTMEGVDPATVGVELVETIARLAPKEGEKPARRTSFAAKFCHFFIDEERFPIYDDAAKKVLELHLGDAYVDDEALPYTGFIANLNCLRAEARLGCTSRELDRYLWVAGMYDKWLQQRRKPKPVMNVELREVFERPANEARAELLALLPSAMLRSGELAPT